MKKIPIFLQIEGTTCTIKRMQVDPDHELGSSPGEEIEDGHFSILYDTIAEDVICSLDRSMSISKIYGGGREVSDQGANEIETFKLITLSTEDILSADKVIAGGIEYEVTDVINYSTHKESMLVKR
jgi:hypothetical protein